MTQDESQVLSQAPQNIVSMFDWKGAEEIKNYLNVLDFHELIKEAELTIQELNNMPLTQDLTKKSKLLLHEYSERIYNESEELHNKFISIYNSLEQKIKEIGQSL